MDFNVTTDYPIDQYVLYKTTSASSSSGSYSVVDIPHELSYIPLIYVQWSETADFDVPRELWQNSGDIYPISEPYVINAYATTSDVSVTFQNWGSNKTIYFRIWGFMPSDSSTNTPYTSSLSGLSDMIVDTDMNYLKLFSEDVVDVGISSPQTVTHNLGYLPVVMVWREYDLGGRMVEPLFSPLAATPFANETPSVTTNNIIFPASDFQQLKYHYRIYGDSISG